MSDRPQWLYRDLIVGPYVTLCLTEKEFHTELRRMSPKITPPAFLQTSHAHATAHHFENQKGDLCCVVCLGDCSGRRGVEVAGLLVHEAVHIWQEFAARIGENSPSAEFEAYAIQSIFQRLMAEFERRITKKKGKK